MKPTAIFTIELAALPGFENDPGRRLALALKYALRTCGLKCTDYREGKMRDSGHSIDSEASESSTPPEVSKDAENEIAGNWWPVAGVVDEDVETV